MKKAARPTMILAGIGRFGAGWYRLLKDEYTTWRVAVVDTDPSAQARLDAGDPFYTSLSTAIQTEAPVFVLNATPPGQHPAVDHTAFDHGLPVLSEKPVATSLAQARQVVEHARQAGLPFAIAENFRRFPAALKMKEVIDAGAVGEIAAVHVQFFREFYDAKPYLVAMDEPLLIDVAVHHLDLLRFLTGVEGRRLLARSYRPHGSPYPGQAAVDILLEMQGGVMASYSGSLSAGLPQTSWMGAWRVQGRRGTVLGDEDVRLVQGEQVTGFGPFPAWNLRGALDDFLAALNGSRPLSVDAGDYLHTQALVHAAQESIRLGQLVDVPAV